ncbi:MAG: hypothetical protein ACREL3_00130 [Gemmatimonadales bacterium]
MVFRRRAAAVGALAILGCGHPAPPAAPAPAAAPAPTAPPSPASACLIGTSGVGSRDTLTVIVPQSDSATVASANDFDTLIRLDCEGRPIPGLASSWTHDSSGAVWTFVLPGSAAPGALDVASAWNSSDSASAVLEVSGVKEAVPADDGKLVVTLEHPAESVPSIFADRSLGLPHGAASPTIVVRATDGRDPRDLLDTSPDVLVTGDPNVLDYASKRPGSVLAPLPWDRVYVLLLAPEGRPPSALIPADSSAFREELARDAVRSEARAAEPPYWWSDLSGCSDSTLRVPIETGGTSQVTIGYPASDPVARALAERIVGLGDSSWFARGLATHDFETALRGGGMDAYILPLPRRSLVPCRDASWPAGAALVPLVETRRTAILRKDGPALVVGGDGSLRPDTPSGSP